MLHFVSPIFPTTYPFSAPKVLGDGRAANFTLCIWRGETLHDDAPAAFGKRRRPDKPVAAAARSEHAAKRAEGVAIDVKLLALLGPSLLAQT